MPTWCSFVSDLVHVLRWFVYLSLQVSWVLCIRSCYHFSKKLLRSYHIILVYVIQEDNATTAMLSPEVIHCTLQWTLCYNVGLTVLIIFRLAQWRCMTQLHSYTIDILQRTYRKQKLITPTLIHFCMQRNVMVTLYTPGSCILAMCCKYCDKIFNSMASQPWVLNVQKNPSVCPSECRV